MSVEGYLLINNYVIVGVDQIIVVLCDGCEIIVQLVGSDLEIDLVVLKIDFKNLLVMIFGCFDGICIGDVCFVIGNLFGVGQIVIMGIISVIGCNQFGLNIYEDFIQIDVVINFGNFGGVLVDVVGNLIGINMVIFFKFGGFQGIGFVILIKLVLEVMQLIIEYGQVICGWFGVEVKVLILELVELLGFGEIVGIVVVGVYCDGLVVCGGLLLGDVILIIDKQEVSDGCCLMNQVVCICLGQKISIVVLCNGQKVNLIVEVGLCLLLVLVLQQKQDGGE